jgi:hypothetical protein
MFSMDEEARVRAMLVALGPGGTRELAERALGFLDGIRAFEDGRYDWMGGLAEVAELLDRSRPAVSNWNATPKLATPEPLRRLTATPVWDLRHWREWGRAHPELMGPGFDPFVED